MGDIELSGEVYGLLFLAADYETGISGIRGDQVSVPIACRVEPLASATSDSIVFVSHDSRGIAEASSDRPNDLAVAVADIMFVQHSCFPLHVVIQRTIPNRLVSDKHLW